MSKKPKSKKAEKSVYESVEELIDIKHNMRMLLDEALDIIRQHDKHEYERAKCYWYAHIRMALDNDHDYLGRTMATIEDSIEGLENSAEQSEE